MVKTITILWFYFFNKKKDLPVLPFVFDDNFDIAACESHHLLHLPFFVSFLLFHWIFFFFFSSFTFFAHVRVAQLMWLRCNYIIMLKKFCVRRQWDRTREWEKELESLSREEEGIRSLPKKGWHPCEVCKERNRKHNLCTINTKEMLRTFEIHNRF